MTDIHRSITPSGLTTIRAPRHLRTASRSPTRNHSYSDDTDDLLHSLKPFCVVESLRAPIGALKTCLDQASSSEQAFAMRAAAASKHINDWYEELCEWPWPRDGGSAGFEPPAPALGLPFKRTTTSSNRNSDPSNRWRGSIAPEDLILYQDRVDKIMDEMQAMDINEMKTTVLHSHILPLSRPGTPYSDTGRSVTSALSYVKMEDLTAVITAIILYCLPILSRLRKLMNAWSIRLTVLDKIPELLLSLEDVEAALKAGWDVVAPSSKNGAVGPTTELSKGTFDVMRKTLEPKVTKVCKLMDYMLDSLEATPDTVPDSWIDRVDKVEQSWREWVVAGNHRVQGGAWVKANKPPALAISPSKLTIQVHAPSPTRDRFIEEDAFSSSPPPPFDHSSIVDELPNHTEEHVEAEVKRSPAVLESPIKLVKRKPQPPKPMSPTRPNKKANERSKARNGMQGQLDGASELRPSVRPSKEFNNKISRVQMLMRKFSGENVSKASPPRDTRTNNAVLSEVNRNIVRAAPWLPEKSSEKQPVAIHQPAEEESDEDWDGYVRESPPLDSSFMEPSILETVEEEDTYSEPDLPRYPRRMASNISMASTVVHDTSRLAELDASDSFREDSMDPEFELPPLADPDQPFSSDAVSPPSSPPLRFQRRTASVSFDEMPQIFPSRGLGPPITQEELNSSAVFDADTTADYEAQQGSHSRMSTISMTSEEDHLHQQIKEVLQNIPAQIKLSRSSKPAVNLNPPDFQAPGKPRSRPSEPFRRSTSAMSSRGGTPSYSRSGTPSFMLAPVREPRQRPKSSQDIKTYHLSRSTGEAPIKLFIRCVGENGERVMVRVGGGWSDLGEYLKEYAAHHGRKSKGEGKVEVRDSPQPGNSSRMVSSPSNRPASAMEAPSTPLAVRKTRRSMGEHDARRPIRTPIMRQSTDSPSPDYDMSRMSVRSDFDEETSSLGLAGPKPARKEMSDESRQWVESVREKVRLVSSERAPTQRAHSGSFGTINKVGGTTRLFRKT